jgi:hypothetical protein
MVSLYHNPTSSVEVILLSMVFMLGTVRDYA